MATSPNKGYNLQATGSNSGTWGSTLNTDVFTIVDNNLGGLVTKSLTNVNVTLSATESQALNLVLTGTLTGAVQITTSCVGMTIVDSQCTGSFAVTFTNGVGSAVTIANGSKYLIMIDATNGCRQVGAGVTSVVSGFGLTGGTITGTGTLSISTTAPPSGFDLPINMSLAASVAANALTISIKDAAGSDPSSTSPVLIPFRSATASTGTVTWLAITAATSIVVSSGSTLGFSNSTPGRFWVIGFNDGSTFRMGVINCFTTAGIFPLAEYQLLSSSAEGGSGGADSAGVVYTGTAVTSKAYRILGYCEYTAGLATAGTWNASPDIIQVFGPGIKRPGDTVQIQESASAAVASGTSQIPNDDTIPQNTEGTQFFSLAVTPTSPANRLYIKYNGNYAFDTIQNGITALFQDSTASALAAVMVTEAVANTPMVHVLSYNLRAATSSSTTFKIRTGSQLAGVVCTLNGTSAARLMGGVLYSRLEISEIMA